MSEFRQDTKHPDNDTPINAASDPDAVDTESLEKLMKARKERYMDQKAREGSGRTFSKRAVIIILSVVCAYLMAAFLLNATGVITTLTMTIMIGPVILITAIWYFWTRRK